MLIKTALVNLKKIFHKLSCDFLFSWAFNQKKKVKEEKIHFFAALIQKWNRGISLFLWNAEVHLDPNLIFNEGENM